MSEQSISTTKIEQGVILLKIKISANIVNHAMYYTSCNGFTMNSFPHLFKVILRSSLQRV
jgi:hypothetical protein